MLDLGNEPRHVTLAVDGFSHPAIAIALSGHRAAIRTKAHVEPQDEVTLSIEWNAGATTTLRGFVAETVGDPGCRPVTYIHLTAVEGDWRPFLSYAGATALAG